MNTAKRPLRHLLALLLATLCASAAAEPASSLAPESAEGYTLRLIGGGDWIAAVKDDAGPTQAGALLIAPVRVQPEVGGTAGIGVGGFVDLGSGRLYGGADRIVDAPVYRLAATPVWCGGITALMGAAGMADDCVASLAPTRLPDLSRTQLTLGYTLDGRDVQLVYGDTTASASGTDWLIVPPDASSFGTGNNAIAFVLPGATGYAPSRDFTLSGSLPMGRFGDLTLAAGYAQLRPQSAFPSPTQAFPIAPLDQTALRLGVRRGAFTGAITGRVVRSENDPNARAWTGLDLGISWRTPWAGEISFGAENLIGRGNNGLLPTPPDAANSDNAARTPYVRYRQDL